MPLTLKKSASICVAAMIAAFFERLHAILKTLSL